MPAPTTAPAWLIHMFALTDTGDVRWITEDEFFNLDDDVPGLPKRGFKKVAGKPHRYKHNKRLPWGQKAGGRRVQGHGRLVHISGRQLLTADIAGAIRFGYYWLWDTCPRQPDPFEAADDDLAACVLMHNTWYLDHGTLRWLVKPYQDIPAGSEVKGMPLVGRTHNGKPDRAVQRKGCYYLASDIEHVLTHGRLPWAAGIEWD